MEVKINFYLKEPNSKAETLLLCKVYTSRKQSFKKTTRLKINPKDWNKEKQEVRRTNPNYKEINLILENLKTDYKNHSLNANILKKKFTKEYLNINTKVNPNNQNESSFFEVWDKWVSNKKNSIVPKTLQRYNGVKKHLLEFETTNSYKLTFESIDENFYTQFIEYMLNVKEIKNAYLSRVIKFIKSFQSYSFEEDLHDNRAFKKFKLFKDNTEEIISLEAGELRAIIDLENLTELQLNARDLFLFLCFTGVRYSDLKNLNNNTIKNNSISIITQKTKELVYIPISKDFATLLKVYAPQGTIKINVLSNPILNKVLKEIGKLAGLENDIKKTRFAGTEVIENTFKKYELLTTHTGKRTFITLAILQGISIEVIQKIVGNKDVKTFQKYQRFNNAQLDEEIKKWNLN